MRRLGGTAETARNAARASAREAGHRLGRFCFTKAWYVAQCRDCPEVVQVMEMDDGDGWGVADDEPEPEPVVEEPVAAGRFEVGQEVWCSRQRRGTNGRGRWQTETNRYRVVEDDGGRLVRVVAAWELLGTDDPPVLGFPRDDVTTTKE